MENIKEHIAKKIFSARFLSMIMIVGTYCIAILYCLRLVGKNAMELETFLGMFIGFSGLASFIVKSYHDIKRKEEDEKTLPGNNP